MIRSVSDGRLWTATAVLTVVALVFLLPPAGVEQDQPQLKYSGALQALDLWAAQRAYPGNLIPAGGFGRAWEQSKLIPRVEDAAFVQAHLEITNHPVPRLVRLIVVDPLQNSTEYLFSDYRENSGLADDYFTFVPPPGTEVWEEQGASESGSPPISN